MEGQWNYQLSIEGAIIKVPTDGVLLQNLKERGFYNHLATALEGLLQLNMYGFDDQFGPARLENRWNRLYRSATITSVDTGKPLVSMLNLPIPDNHRNPFLHPGLYLSFDIGVSRFEKLAGLSLEPLSPMDGKTVQLASYEYGDHQTLLANPGLADLHAAIASKREQEALELYRVFLTGRPEATTYYQTSYHYHNLRGSLSGLLSTDLARFSPDANTDSITQHGIGLATLQYGTKAYPVATLMLEERSKAAVVLPGAYLLTSSDPTELERNSGIDFTGLAIHKYGNLSYLKLASLSQDGKTLQPFEALQKIRDNIIAQGPAPFSFRYHVEPAKGNEKTHQPGSGHTGRPFQTLHSALHHFLSIRKEVLGSPFLDGWQLTSVELLDHQHQKIAGRLFKQKTTTGQLAAGYYLQVDPAYLSKVFRDDASALKMLQRDSDLHILLSPVSEKMALKKNMPKASKQKPPPGGNGKTRKP